MIFIKVTTTTGNTAQNHSIFHNKPFSSVKFKMTNELEMLAGFDALLMHNVTQRDNLSRRYRSHEPTQ
jgi:hypothetical protein